MSDEIIAGVGTEVKLADDDLPVMAVGADPADPALPETPAPAQNEPEAEQKPAEEEQDPDEYDIEAPLVKTTSEPFISEKGKAWEYDTPMESFNGPIEDLSLIHI